MWKVLNFEWILLFKIQTNYKKMGFEGKMTWMYSHLGPTTHVTLPIHEGSLFCFVIMISPKSQCFGLSYGTYHQKSSQWTWVHQLGLECLELQHGIYGLLNHFFIDFFLKPKIENYITILGHFWYCWKALTKFDLIKLIL